MPFGSEHGDRHSIAFFGLADAHHMVYIPTSAYNIYWNASMPCSNNSLCSIPTHARQYHRIAALRFFRQYSQWKSFAEWKSFVRIRKWAKCRAVLEEDLFTLHPWLRIGMLHATPPFLVLLFFVLFQRMKL